MILSEEQFNQVRDEIYNFYSLGGKDTKGYIKEGVIQNLFDTIESQQQEIDELKYGKETAELLIEKYVKEMDKQDNTIDNLRKALEQAKRVLEFYGDTGNYFGVGDVPGKVGMDCGTKANRALKQIAEVEG